MEKNKLSGYIGFIITTIALVAVVIAAHCTNADNNAMEPEDTVISISPTATPSTTPSVQRLTEINLNATPMTVESINTKMVYYQPMAAKKKTTGSSVTPTPTEEPSPTPTPVPKKTKKKKVEEPKRENKLYKVKESYGTYMLDIEYQDYTYEMCKKYGVEEYYTLFIALMWHESNFKVDDISRTNDYGLMQINKCNHSWLKKELDIDPDFLNPYTSIECGVYMMSSYLKKYEDVHKALVAYNMGENAVKKYSSTKYSRTVVDIMENKLVVYKQKKKK